jgi:hypothetical protein
MAGWDFILGKGLVSLLLVVGLIPLIVRRRRSPRAVSLGMVGLAILLVDQGAGSAAAEVLVIRGFNVGRYTGLVIRISNAVISVLTTFGIGFLIAAILADRKATSQDLYQESESP